MPAVLTDTPLGDEKGIEIFGQSLEVDLLFFIGRVLGQFLGVDGALKFVFGLFREAKMLRF